MGTLKLNKNLVNIGAVSSEANEKTETQPSLSETEKQIDVDSELVNAEESVSPAAINAQKSVGSGAVFDFLTIYYWVDMDGETVEDPHPGELKVETSFSSSKSAYIDFDLSGVKNIDFTNSAIQLQLTTKKDAIGKFIVRNNYVDTFFMVEPNKKYLFDITSLINERASGKVEIHPYGYASFEFETTGANAPQIVITKSEGPCGYPNEVLGALNTPSYYKNLNTTDRFNFSVDLINKNTQFVLKNAGAENTYSNIDLTHVFTDINVSDNKLLNLGYGRGFCLNVMESLRTIDGKRYLVDCYGKKIAEKNNYVNGMKYTDTVPSAVDGLTVYKDLFNNYKSADRNWQLPVKWLVGTNVIKGFNCYGSLVMISDVFKNCVQLVYRTDNRINKMVSFIADKQIGELTFIYNCASDLQKLISGTTELMSYHYNDDRTFKVIFYRIGGGSLNFSYENDRITNIDAPDNIVYKFEYGASEIKSIVYSRYDGIPDGNYNQTEISNVCVKFSDNKVFVGENECYMFKDNQLNYLYELRNDVVVSAEKYTTDYRDDGTPSETTVVKAKIQTLGETALNSFVFTDGESTVTTYNDDGLPSNVKTQNAEVSLNTFCNKEVNYTYNDNKLCTEEKTVVTYSATDLNKSYTMHTLYEYDSKNMPVKKTVYVDGEQATQGKEISEYTYNTAGNIDKIISYNSLEPSKKFCASREYDGYGRITSDSNDVAAIARLYSYKSDERRVSEMQNFAADTVKYDYTINGRISNVTFENGKGHTKKHSMKYKDGEVTEISGGSEVIKLTYDGKHRLNGWYKGNLKAQSIVYSDDGTKVTIEKGNLNNYANAAGVSVTKEKYEINETVKGKKLEYKFNGATIYSEDYNTDGTLSRQNDLLNNTDRAYEYDGLKRVVKVSETDGVTENFSYNKFGAIESVQYSGAVTRTEKYAYENNSKMRLSKADYENFTVEPAYDLQGRLSGKKIRVGGSEAYNTTLQYAKGAAGATNMPSKITYRDGSYMQYSYNDRANIVLIDYGNNSYIIYTYDDYGRLIKEDNGSTGKVYTYTYDNDGNLLGKAVSLKIGKNEVAVASNVFMYSNGRLINDGRGVISYDVMGRPVRYCNKVMSWSRGNLASYGQSAYEYDGLGRRISKTVNGEKTSYTYDSRGRLIKSSDGMEYYYDATGVIGFEYNGSMYLYKKDIQGNITAILDNSGMTVVRYNYDAWGSHTVSGSNMEVGELNPFRYRGYFFDTDSGFYYLQTRYYDPEVGRFISPDSVRFAAPETIDGLNLYAYCGNDPVNYVDFMGNIPVANIINRFTLSRTFEGLYSPIWGRIGYSASITKQDKETGFFYAFKGSGGAFNENGNSEFIFGGVGINVWGWIGVELGYNNNYNVTVGGNITPWFHYGVEVGLNGINITLGINIEDTSHDITFGIGLGLVAVAAAGAAVVFSGGTMLEPFLDFLRRLFA